MTLWFNPTRGVESIPTLVQAVDEVAEDPLIDQGSEDAIYIGIALLVIVLTIALGGFSGRLKSAVLLALLLSGVLIAIIFAV